MAEIKTTWKYHQVASAEQQAIDWAKSLKHVGTVKTIPELLDTLDKTEEANLENFLDLNFFKQNIAPMWEDPNNISGGRIIAEIPSSLKDKVHTFWKRTVVFCATEPFSGINGCTYGWKTNYRICIWISDASVAEDVKNAWKYLLDCNDVTFTFSLHSDRLDGPKTRRKGGFSRNADRG